MSSSEETVNIIPVDMPPRAGVWFRRNWIKIIVGLLGVGLLALGVLQARRWLNCAADRKVEQFLQEAETAYSSSRYSQALSLYQQAVDQNPGKVDAYLGQARIYVLKNKFAQAEKVLTKGLAKTDDQEDIYFALGGVAMKAKDYRAAVDYFSQADLDKIQTQLDLLEAHLRLGELVSAEKSAQAALELNENNVRLQYYRALMASTDNPHSAVSLINLAAELSNDTDQSGLQSEVSRFQDNLSRALQESDHYRETLIGFALLQEGFPQLALIPLKGVAEEQPRYRDGRYLSGAAYLQLGEGEKALEHLNEALTVDPNHAHSYYLLGKTYARMDKDLRARESFQSACFLASNQTVYYDAYLDFLEEKKDFSEREEVLKDIVGSDSFTEEEKRDYKVQLAYLYLDQMGKLQEGLSAAREFKGTEVYAWALFKNEQSEAALQIIKELIAEEPTAWLYYRQGKIQQDLGQAVEAEKSFERALDLDTKGEVSELLEGVK